jgi:hypothetical protein
MHPALFTTVVCLLGLGALADAQSPSPCASNQCLNGGSCADSPGGAFTCACPTGITGERCHLQVNECASSPCQNGATCRDRFRAFQCECQPGWTGAMCHTAITPCSSSPCAAGSTCRTTDSGTAFACDCEPGWTGSTCAVLIDDCSSSPCSNGGACARLSPSGFVCNCSGTGFSGTLCMDQNVLVGSQATESSSIPWPIIIGAVAGVVALIAFVVFVATLAVKKKQRQLEWKRQQSASSSTEDMDATGAMMFTRRVAAGEDAPMQALGSPRLGARLGSGRSCAFQSSAGIVPLGVHSSMLEGQVVHEWASRQASAGSQVSAASAMSASSTTSSTASQMGGGFGFTAGSFRLPAVDGEQAADVDESSDGSSVTLNETGPALGSPFAGSRAAARSLSRSMSSARGGSARQMPKRPNNSGSSMHATMPNMAQDADDFDGDGSRAARIRDRTTMPDESIA